MKRLVFFVLVFLCAGSGSSSFGRDELGKTLEFVSDMPLKITAAEVVAENTPEGRKVIYNGDVKATQGDLTMTCNHLELFWKSDSARSRPSASGPGLNMGDLASLHSITALGDVKFVQGDRMAISGEAIYDHKRGTITLRRGAGPKPMLWYGKDHTVAEIIVVYINENRVEMKNDGGKARTVTIISPKQKK